MRAQGFTTIRVEGHTDGQGGSKNAEKLSQARADAVVAYLAKYVKVEASTLAKSEKTPVASNASATGQAKNRRAVVYLVK